MVETNMVELLKNGDPKMADTVIRRDLEEARKEEIESSPSTVLTLRRARIDNLLQMSPEQRREAMLQKYLAAA
ncbi:MAG TPA: hypothetical protein VNA68_00060 [Candidatus Dormibacteraeota bacterium]|nr:hypothetical protein [Candidatus Dormibacteraeota bacterium]